MACQANASAAGEMRVKPRHPARHAVANVIGQPLEFEADGIAPALGAAKVELSQSGFDVAALLIERDDRLETTEPVHATGRLEPAAELVELPRDLDEPLVEYFAIERPGHATACRCCNRGGAPGGPLSGAAGVAALTTRISIRPPLRQHDACRIKFL